MFCVFAFHAVHLPDGEETDRRSVVLGAIAMLFLFVALPAFILSIRGLRASRSADAAESAGRDRNRVFGSFFAFLDAVNGFWILVAAVISFLAGLFE